MRNIILKNISKYNFGTRLRNLMDAYTPILKNANELSEAMHKKGILKYEEINREGKPKTEHECIRNGEKTINNHLGKSDCKNVSTEWIKHYCDFFKCSADYLLGYIDLPTHTETDINKETGLLDDAINTLKAINFRANTQLGDSALMRLSTLNYILKNDEAFENFLGNLAIYIDNNYKTPLYLDPDRHCYIDVSYTCANGEKGMTFGYLTKDNKGNDGYEALGVDVNILESHAMLKMQEIMKDWKDSHKKQS